MIRIPLFMIMASVSISCNVSRNASNPSETETNPTETSRILFIDYQIKRDSSNDTYEAELLNAIITNGTIKEDQLSPSTPEEGDLEVTVQDQNGQIMTQRFVPNPLDRPVEYVNDAGELGQKMLHLDSAQFSVRLQIEAGVISVVLHRYTDYKTEGTLLLKTTIR